VILAYQRLRSEPRLGERVREILVLPTIHIE
jgi:hypothetical protein